MDLLIASSREVVAALIGACVALVIPFFSQTPSRRRRRALPPCWWIALLVSALGGVCVHAAKQAVTTGPFSVKLKRQLIPMPSSDGIAEHKSAYYGELSVGGPKPQLFDVVFDTGSGHLILPSTMCRSQTCLEHRRYKRRASVHAQDIDIDGTSVRRGQERDQITVSFGTGEVTGIFVRDRACLGAPPPVKPAISSSLLQVGQQLLGFGSTSEESSSASAMALHRATAMDATGCVDLGLIATTEMSDDPFRGFGFDGVLGLGLQGLSQAPLFNFLDAAASSGAWRAKPGHEMTFAVFLAAPGEEEQSEITFGGWKEERLREDHSLSWQPVLEPELGYWQVRVFGITANGRRSSFCDVGGCRAIVDTGSSLLGVPSVLARELLKTLRHTDDSGGNCDGPGPELVMELANFSILLDPVDYAHPKPSPEGNNSAGALPGTTWAAAAGATAASTVGSMQKPKEAADRTVRKATPCVPMLMHLDLPQPLGSKTLVLGEPVLRKYFTVFDAGAKRIGFADAIHRRDDQRIFL